MEIILLVICALYCIYLNVRIKQVEGEVDNSYLEREEFEVKVYNKMMEIRKDLKNEKSGRKSTKKRSRLSKNAIPKSKILRKFRGDKNFLQAGGKG